MSPRAGAIAAAVLLLTAGGATAGGVAAGGEAPASDIGTESRLDPGEFDLACAPAGTSADLFRAPDTARRDARLSERVHRGWSFNIYRLYETPAGQMASGTAHSGRWTVNADPDRPTHDARDDPQLYILTRQWACDLYRP